MKKPVLAKNIKKLRLFKTMNQTEFGALFDLTRSSIGAYEEGRAEPKLDALIKFSNYFELTIDEIVKAELTVNQIAKFEFPQEDPGDILSLSEKMDALLRRVEEIDRKVSITLKKEKK